MIAAGIFNLNPEMKTLFVFGGSQGSEVLNQTVAKMSSKLKDVQMIWQTGPNHVEKYSNFSSEKLCVIPFIDDMHSAYAMSDLSLTRAGAITIAELTACGIPGIYVPLPSAAADHQTHNARSVADHHAGIMIPESALNPESLATQINEIIHDPVRLNELSENAKKLGRPDATQTIVDHIIEKVGN